MKECEVDFNPEFTSRVIPKLDWPEVVRAAQVLGQLGDTPAEIPSDYENNEDFLKKAHHLLMEIEIINGDLVS